MKLLSKFAFLFFMTAAVCGHNVVQPSLHADNSTDNLEVRVTILENDITYLQDEVEELESDNSQQDDRFLIIEGSVARNSNDIGDLETTVDETDLVLGLQVEVTQLLERLTVLETAVASMSVSTQENFDEQQTQINDLAAHITDQDERISTLEAAVNEPWEACSSSPCDNGGTCIDVNVDAFICMCRDGFFGITCGDSYSGTSFLATFDTNAVTPGDPIVFNYTVINTGGHYDSTTGIYTVPLNGTYEFILRIRTRNDANCGAVLVVDGLRLHEGQEVWVTPYGIMSIDGAFVGFGMSSWFSGHLVYAL